MIHHLFQRRAIHIASSVVFLSILLSCQSNSRSIGDDDLPVDRSPSRVTFEADSTYVAGTTIPDDRPVTLVYEPGRPLLPGSEIQIAFPTAVQEEAATHWSIPTTDPSQDGTVLVGGDARDRLQVLEAGRAPGGAGRITLAVRRLIEPGETFKIGLTGQVPQIVPQSPFRVWELSSSDGRLAELAPENVALPPVVPAEPEYLHLSLAPDAVVSEPSSLNLAVLDRFGNVATQFVGSIALSTDLMNCPPVVEISAHDAGRTEVTGLTSLQPGVFHVVARLEGNGRSEEFSSNPMWCHPMAPRYRRFFGDAHVHTGSNVYSYAVRGGDHRGHFVTNESAIEYMRRVSAIDWAVFAAHDTGLSDETWTESQTRLAELSGSAFVALAGFEWTPNRRVGHHIVVYEGDIQEDGSLYAASSEGRGQPATSVEQLVGTIRNRLRSGHRALVIPHMMQPFPNGDPNQRERELAHETWDGPAGTRTGGYVFNDFRRVAEIYSHHNDDFTRGDFRQTTEGRGDAVDQPQLFELGTANPWSLQHAWSAGHRVGVVSGSDNHLGTPGIDDFSRHVPHHSGLTVVLASELTRDAIFDGLYERRCYATTGARILLNFSAGEAPMGSELVKKLGETIRLRVEVVGTAPLAAVEVLTWRDGEFELAGSGKLDGRGAGSSFEISDRLDRSTLYYVRVRQVDGEMAWSSPIWVDAL